MKKLVKKGISDVFVSLCQTKPVEKITIRDIVEEAGISKQTFYNYFKDKSDVMLYSFEVIADEYASRMAEDMDNLEQLFSEFFEVFIADCSYYSKIANYNTQNNFYNTYLSFTKKFYITHLTNKHGADVLAPQILCAIDFFCYGSLNLVLNWIQDDGKMQSKEMAAIVYACMPPLLKELL